MIVVEKEKWDGSKHDALRPGGAKCGLRSKGRKARQAEWPDVRQNLQREGGKEFSFSYI